MSSCSGAGRVYVLVARQGGAGQASAACQCCCFLGVAWRHVAGRAATCRPIPHAFAMTRPCVRPPLQTSAAMTSASMLLKASNPTLSRNLLIKAQALYTWGKSKLGEAASD